MNATDRTRRFTLIYATGCIACLLMGRTYTPCQIHHLNIGGRAGQKRRGDEFTIGLCPYHHQGHMPPGIGIGQMIAIFGPSLARASKAFRRKFGNDDFLLKKQNELIA